MSKYILHGKEIADKDKIIRAQRKVIVFLLTICIIMACLFIFDSLREYSQKSIVSEEKWDIVLPSGLVSEYSISNAGFLGDGLSYQIASGNNSYDFYSSLQNKKDGKIENRFLSILKELGVPEEKYPDFSHDYLWIEKEMPSDTRNTLICIYDIESKQYYFVKSTY